MSNFIYIFRGGQTPNASPEAMQAQMQKWMNWIQRLKERGTYISGEPLQPGGKVVSSSSAKKIITDGPFAEGKEVVAGFFLIRAESLDEATEISQDCPVFDTGGSVEVRAIRVINP
jgi:hypothetical protein